MRREEKANKEEETAARQRPDGRRKGRTCPKLILKEVPAVETPIAGYSFLASLELEARR
jgi:hypothetical protein